MNKFWISIYQKINPNFDIEQGISHEDIITFIQETFSSPGQSELKNAIIDELFKDNPLEQINQLNNEKAQAHILCYMNQKKQFHFYSNEKQRPMSLLEILIDSNSSNHIFKIYFDSLSIPFNLSSDEPFSITNILDGQHSDAFKHLLPLWSLWIIDNPNEFKNLPIKQIGNIIEKVKQMDESAITAKFIYLISENTNIDTFKSHPIRQLFSQKIDANLWFKENFEQLKSLRPLLIQKLLSSHDNILEKAFESQNNQAILWVIEQLEVHQPDNRLKILLSFMKKKNSKIKLLDKETLNIYLKITLLILHNSKDSVLDLLLNKISDNDICKIVTSLLDKDKKLITKILSQKNSDGWNTLMIAARYHPDAVQPILHAISNLIEEKNKIKILSQKNRWGRNTLMIAAIEQPSAVQPILNAISNLTDENVKIQILSQQSNDGCNALMLAAQYHPDGLQPLIQSILILNNLEKEKEILETLNKVQNFNLNSIQLSYIDDFLLKNRHPWIIEKSVPNGFYTVIDWQKVFENKNIDFKTINPQILIQKDKDGLNVLMFAAQFHPKTVQPMLDAISNLIDENAKIEILSQKNNNEWSALMLAARYHPDAVQPILDAISNLSYEKDKIEILSQKYKSATNALMFAAENHPDAVQPILDAISNLSYEKDKIQILSQKSIWGNNALMLAVRYRQDAVQPILDATSNLIDEKNRIKILSQHSYDGYNAFMLAAKHHPGLVQPILDAIFNLTDENVKIQILSQQSNDGWNALMLAARYYPKAVQPILDAIFNLTDENVKIQILSQQSNDGWNALMLAAQYHPDGLQPLIQSILILNNLEKEKEILATLNKVQNFNLNSIQLSYEDDFLLKSRHPWIIEKSVLDSFYRLFVDIVIDWQKVFENKNIDFKTINPQILIQKDKDGLNVLMFAAQFHPKTVQPILDAISNLSYEKDKIEILSQQSKDGWNALMIAARYHPGAVQPILDAISNLSYEKDKIEILSQKSSDGWNALTLAARYHPDAVKPILETISNLTDENVKIQILSQQSNDGWNALVLAARCHPNAVQPILDAISNLTNENTKIQIISQKNNNGWNTLMLATKYHADGIQPILSSILSLEKKSMIACFSMSIDTWSTFIGSLKTHAQNKIICGLYPLLEYPWIQKNSKLYDAVNEILIEYESSQFSMDSLNLNNIEKQLQIAFDYAKDAPKEFISDLIQHIQTLQIKKIVWPDESPYNRITDTKNIEDILKFITPEYLTEAIHLQLFKFIYQQWPIAWQEALLKRCHLNLQTAAYQEIYQTLNPSESLDELGKSLPSAQATSILANPVGTIDLLGINTNETLPLPSAPPMPSERIDLGVGQSATYLQQSESAVVNARTLTSLWQYTHRNLFLKAFKSADEQSIHELIKYLRNPSILNTFNQQKILDWIQSSPDAEHHFHLQELSYLAQLYEKQSDGLKISEPQKSADLKNLSIRLLQLQKGLLMIDEAKINANSSDESLSRIHKLHLEFLNHNVHFFEKIKTAYPKLLNFDSLLKHPNRKHQHILVELAPRPIPESKIKPESKIDANIDENLLHTQVGDTCFISQVHQYKDKPQLFSAIDKISKKNILQKTLETNDKAKINAVAQAVSEFNLEHRRDILCNSKLFSYPLTNFVKSADFHLHLLELERLILKLETLNDRDPNIRILRQLFNDLKNPHHNPSGLIENARQALNQNTTWRNWFFGSYGSTGYGIGIFKNTLSSLLKNLEQSMPKQSSNSNIHFNSAI